MSPTLALRVLELDDLTVVGLDGVMGADSSHEVTDVVDAALARDVSTIVLDCSLLTTIDVEASEELEVAAEHVHARHGRLVVRQPSASTRAVLDLTGTSDVVEFGD
jgi:anti-anti-sigma factor